MADWVFRDGQRLTAWMLYQINRLDAMMYSLFGVHVIVSSGLRTYAEQVAIFLDRYVTAGNVRGRKVYDTRVWNGVRYYRISAAGTVAVPGTSNHEVQGNDGAADLRDTGRDAGIASGGNARANWLRAHAHEFGMVAEGYNFREPWHYKFLDIFRTPPGAPAGGGATTPARKENDMSILFNANGNIYTLSFGQIKLETDPKFVGKARAAGEVQVDGVGTTAQQNEQFVQWLDHFGIPRAIDGVRMLDERGWVLNPETGIHEYGGMWSWERANRALMRALATPKAPAPTPKGK